MMLWLPTVKTPFITLMQSLNKSELLTALLSKLQTQILKNACLWVKIYKYNKDTSLFRLKLFVV